MNKELEVYIATYKEIKRNKEIIGGIDKDFFFDFADTVLNYIENSIPKEKIEEKYQEAENEVIKIREENRTKNNATKYDYLTVGKRDAYKELLEVK